MEPNQRTGILPKLKVMTILGTRPEIIRLSRILPLLDTYTDHRVIYTGQNFDVNLSSIFWDQLHLRSPDYELECTTTSLGGFIADMYLKLEPILKSELPDVMVILGDTNSSLSAYLAKRYRIKIIHIEAGNRCFSDDVPEEVNRRVIDHLADLNLVYSEQARRNLLAEGIHPSSIYLVGSPMFEVLDFYAPEIDRSSILSDLHLHPQSYFVASIHREETVDHAERLKSVIEGLRLVSVTYDQPVIFSMHPRTRKRLESTGLMGQLSEFSRIHEPFGLFDYLQLQRQATCVLSDSGTLSEESAIMGFPAVLVRGETERQEALDSGTVSVSGYKDVDIVRNVEVAINYTKFSGTKRIIPDEYRIPDTSWRTLRHIMGTV